VEGDIQWKWLWKKFASTYYDKSKETGQCGIFQSSGWSDNERLKVKPEIKSRILQQNLYSIRRRLLAAANWNEI
jgi:hypothetical protein